MHTLYAIPMTPPSVQTPRFPFSLVREEKPFCNFRGVREIESGEMNSACLPQELKRLTCLHATCTANVLIFSVGGRGTDTYVNAQIYLIIVIMFRHVELTKVPTQRSCNVVKQ